MLKIKKKKKGLTLIETLISFIILTFVLTPILMIVNSSVATNKAGEYTQKELYIIQKYAEKFKRQDVDLNNLSQTFSKNPLDTQIKDDDIPDGYFVKVDITPLTEYQFGDVTTAQPINRSYSSIEYDAKIIINKNDSGIGTEVADLVVKDKNGTSVAPIDKKALLNNYTLEISNGKDNAGGGEDDQIMISLKNSDGNNVDNPWIITNKNQPSNANVIIQVDSNETVQSNVNLNINYWNKINQGNMGIYFVKSKNTATSSNNYDIINCHFGNEQGVVKVYSNIYNKSSTDTYSSTRLYKVNISLFKNDENPDNGDKPIQQLTTYKTVQQ